MLIKYPFDVLCITETKIKNNSFLNITIPGYDFFHADSPTNAGGVAIYISNTLKSEQVLDFNLNLALCKELWFTLFTKSHAKKYLIGVVCRHPKQCKTEFIDKFDDTLL